MLSNSQMNVCLSEERKALSKLIVEYTDFCLAYKVLYNTLRIQSFCTLFIH